MLALAWGQVGLGISTLLHAVPVELGSAHQAGALALMSAAIALAHAVRVAPVAIMPPAGRAAAAAAAVAAGAAGAAVV